MTFFDTNTLLEMWFAREKDVQVKDIFDTSQNPSISFL